MAQYVKICISLLFLTSVAFAQFDGPFAFKDDGYESDARIYFNAMSTQLSQAQKTKINTLVKMLKDSLAITSLSSKFYAIYVFSNETQEAALKNLVSRNYDATAVNSPTWGDTGYVGATSKYVNSNFNPVAAKADSTNFSYGMYHKGTVSGGTSIAFMGALTTTPSNNFTTLGWVNAGTSYCASIAVTQWALSVPTYSGANPYSVGMAVVTTNGSRAQSFYHNGALVAPTQNADGSFYPVDFYILARNNAGSAEVYATTINARLAFIGKGLSAANVRAINNCIETYMDSRGHGVQP